MVNGMNGQPLILEAPRKLTEDQQACIEMLTDALEEATKGRISAVAIVVCMDDGIATVMAGKNAGALNMGLDDLKKKIHAAVFEDGNVSARKRSSIVRAR